MYLVKTAKQLAHFVRRHSYRVENSH